MGRKTCVRAASVVAIALVMQTTGASEARADWNQASIAVPAIGTWGAASVYPSTIDVVARGGLGHTGDVTVMLHAVTHPCPEELAVLLVHNNAANFLLMSNAGGCRPLQGTTLIFNVTYAALADTEPSNPPHSSTKQLDASNYGTTPVFPAPAPAGPYAMSMPPQATNINGTWSLYVLDTKPGNRGVIAGGWSLNYDTSPVHESQQTDVAVPAVGTGPGGAESYPITFDLSSVPVGIAVRIVQVALTLHHTYPDNLRILLQSPQGTSVILMANAGGGTDIPAGTEILFGDAAAEKISTQNPIVPGLYKPGSAYESNIALGLPAPQPPYSATFTAMEDEPVRGIWKLWVYDDSSLNAGEIEHAGLTVVTDLKETLVLDTPLPVFNATTDQPFLRIEGHVSQELSPMTYTWRTTVDGDFYAAGAFTRKADGSGVYADIPMKAGSNHLSCTVWNTTGIPSFTTRTIAVNEFTYSLAEGATGAFFDLDVTLANPSATNAPVAVDFLVENGDVVSIADNVSAWTPLQMDVEDHVPGAATSTIVRSTAAVPLAVERTMSWDDRGYGGHGGTSVAPATRWLFAEGAQGYFNTYVLLANNNAAAVDVAIDFLLEGGGLVSMPVSVPARSRYTLFAGDVAGLVDRSFGISINASQPIIAERAMYLPGPHLFEGGHESAGVNSASTRWFLAEGATGPFFDCFVLLSNPGGTAANVTLTYLLPGGGTIVRPLIVPANGRSTINVETVDPLLANTPVSTAILSDVPIVAERAMYWPDISQGWSEAHNSFGVTETALRWGIADGRIGGSRAHQTYILLANPNALAAEVEVFFLKAGATITKSYTLPPTSRLNIWANADVPELGAGTFSADVRVLNYQPIAVEKALYWDADGVTWAAGTNVTATRLPPP